MLILGAARRVRPAICPFEEMTLVSFETDRLIVRNFRSGDAADLFGYLHRPSARCFLSLAVANLAAAKAETVKRSLNDDYLAIWLKTDNRVIGDVFAIAEPLDYIDPSDIFSVGWNINPQFGSMGYAQEAAEGLLKNLFTERNARRLYAYVDDGNTASERLCQRLGMRQEGVFREFVSFVKDEHGAPIFEDTKQYAILASEWISLCRTLKGRERTDWQSMG